MHLSARVDVRKSGWAVARWRSECVRQVRWSSGATSRTAMCLEGDAHFLDSIKWLSRPGGQERLWVVDLARHTFLCRLIQIHRQQLRSKRSCIADLERDALSVGRISPRSASGMWRHAMTRPL